MFVMADVKRITIFAGHYGSGKTNIAVNYALYLKSKGLDVKIADLDIVNPYFRTKDSSRELKDAGIELISSEFANSNVDLPALPAQLYKVVERKECYCVLDVGGDDTGAVALGRYTPEILKEANYEMVFVVNFLRPLTETAEDALEVMKEIEFACKIPFTAIVNNTNLGNDTTASVIEKSNSEAEKLAEISGLPILFTSVRSDLAMENHFPLKLQEKYFDIKEF